MKEKTIENAWSILLKFGKEENLQKLQAGQFYMKNLQYYVDLEKGTSDEDVGDISDITEIMKTKQLLNTYLEVTFSVKPME